MIDYQKTKYGLVLWLFECVIFISKPSMINQIIICF